MTTLHEGMPLGREARGSQHYDPMLLYPVPRAAGRASLGVSTEPLPFFGEDIWHAYEISWLSPQKKPVVALATLSVPASSTNIIESKSLKLYLNSLNGSVFGSAGEVHAVIGKDLSKAAGAPVSCKFSALDDPAFGGIQAPGECVDDLPFTGEEGAPARKLLNTAGDAITEEVLHSHLLRSLCPVTAQPDWATLVVSYRGRPLDRGSLLRYVVAFRNHQDFHEQCVERVFLDINSVLEPERLEVQALYTRRGGLDICPWRSKLPGNAPKYRLNRQ